MFIKMYNVDMGNEKDHHNSGSYKKKQTNKQTNKKRLKKAAMPKGDRYCREPKQKQDKVRNKW